MRIIFVFLISCLIFSCKTKDAIPTDQVIPYVVVLVKPFVPNALKKGIPFEITGFKELNNDLNQWKVDFKVLPKDLNRLRATLLNHPKVISVVTMAQYEKLRLKKGKKAVDGSFGKSGASKQ